MNHYHINIFYSVEDEGYIADIPDLTHCSAFGTSGSGQACWLCNCCLQWATCSTMVRSLPPEIRHGGRGCAKEGGSLSLEYGRG